MPLPLPDTIPLSEPTVADEDTVLHKPPPTVSVRVIAAPAHTPEGPVMAVGDKLTVTVVVTGQPAVDVKVILLVPVAMPVTLPVVAPIVATPVLPLSQVPPPLSVRVMCAPTHKADGPPGSGGVGLIVIVAVR